jgi:hypothetical protein
MSRYNPPNEIIPTFNPEKFQPAIASAGYTNDQITTLNNLITANNTLITSINNSLTTLGSGVIVVSPGAQTTTFKAGSALSVYSKSFTPGIYILSYNIQFGQFPSYTTSYSWTSGTISINNQTGSQYNQTITSIASGGDQSGSAVGACYLYLTTTTTVSITLNITANTTTGQWILGTLGPTPYGVNNLPGSLLSSNTNGIRIVKIKTL